MSKEHNILFAYHTCLTLRGGKQTDFIEEKKTNKGFAIMFYFASNANILAAFQNIQIVCKTIMQKGFLYKVLL